MPITALEAPHDFIMVNKNLCEGDILTTTAKGLVQQKQNYKIKATQKTIFQILHKLDASNSNVKIDISNQGLRLSWEY